MKSFMRYYIFIFITMLILFNPQSTIMYAKSGMYLCSEVLIPSLFPFFVCSGLLIYSGFCSVVSAYLSPVMKPLFNVGGSGAAAFLLGIISGYPLGAACACNLYDGGYLSKTECERLLAFCNNSGPLFILGSVGAAIFHSPKAGIIIYASHILSALIIGIMFRFYKKNDTTKYEVPVYNTNLSSPEVFQKALSGSVNSILTVCGAVIFFSVISNIVADYFSDGSVIKAVLIAASEITSGINRISYLPIPFSMKIIMSAACAGFAGLCVHLQVMGTVSGRGLSLVPYIVGKCMHAILSAIMSAILLYLFPITNTVFAPFGVAPFDDKISGAFFSGALYVTTGIIILLLIALLFLVSRKAVYAIKQRV